VQMGGEPIRRPKAIHDKLGSWVPQSAVVGLALKIGLHVKEIAAVTVLLDVTGPVVADPNVDLGADLEQLADVDLAHVVEALDVIGVEGETLMVRLSEVKALPDAAQTGDAQGPETENIGGAHVVDVGSNPAAIKQLPEV